MTEKKFSLEEIRMYWAEQATKYRESPKASWSDLRAIEMEIREILKYIEDGDRVLDVGCGNGYSTVQFASQKRIYIRGIDITPEMINQANRRVENIKSNLKGEVEFKTGDVTALDERSGSYDKVIAIRVIINLHEWNLQLQGLRECARVLKPQGMLLLSEATLQGWQKMNQFRQEWGLPSIPMPEYNNYLDQEQVIDSLSSHFELIQVNNFSSTYYVGTRVLKPLLIQALRLKIDVSDPDMEWNRWFSELPSWGDYGTQKLFMFKKR